LNHAWTAFFAFEHDLFGKPGSTFPDHALMRPKALIAWSSGKDSAWALHETRRTGDCEVVGALTTVSEGFGRVSMHGVREALLAAQLDAVGLPSIVVRIPYPCPNEIYETRMAAALADAKAAGVTQIIFGDLFLADVRRYREEKLAGTGVTPLFPLWQRPTDALAREMIAAGVETYLASISSSSTRTSRAAASTTRCSPTCRRVPTHAARRASSTPVWWQARCCAGGYR
jgi:diphthamide synthase (EF-2-diphthine--ammonia ligase)